MQTLVHTTLVGLLLSALAIESGLPQNLSTGALSRWELEATLAKTEFVLREPIWLDITLTNITADTQRTHGLELPNCLQFVIDLKDGSGHSLQQVIHFDVMSSPGALLLELGQQDYASFDLAEYFGTLDLYFPTIPCGSYAVQVRFEDAASEEVSLQVVEPSDEANEVFELLRQIHQDWNKEDPSASSPRFREVANRFPASPYAEKCYYLSMIYAPERWNNRYITNDMTSLKRARLEKYPNSGHAPDWIRAITREMDSQEERAFLMELAEAHPESRSAKYVKVALDRLNSQKVGE